MDSVYLYPGCEPQLFVDNWAVECCQGLTRRWHKPLRFVQVPVITRDRPWEQTPYFTYSNHCVIRDGTDGLIKCWYEDLGHIDGQGHPWKSRLLYAESRDGLTFRKPELDICPADGRPTNIVMGFVEGGQKTSRNAWGGCGVHSNGIVMDPNSSGVERYRTIFTSRIPQAEGKSGHKLLCAHSADGIEWQPYEQSPAIGSSGAMLGDVSCIHYDDDARLFVQNTRHSAMGSSALPPLTPRTGGWFAPYYPHRSDLMNKRRVFQTRSADFLHWSDPLPVSVPDDEIDNLDEAHYGMQQFRVGRMHFATLGIFRYVANEMEVRLLFSRDGVNFKPADRATAFLAPRGEGHWDAHMVSITSQPVEMGDELWFYHGGTNSHHDWWIGPPEGIDEPEVHDPDTHVRFGLGLAKLRRDGFASLNGSRQRRGFVLTRPLKSPGRRLMVNARCRRGGWIKAALLDQNNAVIGGRSLDACDAFGADSVRHELTWGGRRELPEPGAWRKIHFLVSDAEIFSFQFQM